MSNPTETLMANLVHAIRTRETVTIGGGRFSPGELREAVQGLARAPTAPDPRDAIIAELVAALGRAESFMAGFEDDELQEGMDGLLGSARAALANAAALQAGQ